VLLVLAMNCFFDQKSGPEYVEVPPVDGYSESVIKYHCTLLYEAGFIAAEPVRSSTSDRIIKVLPFELTWHGHEFLDKIRNPHVWDEVISNVKERGLISASLDIVKKLADAAIRKKFDLD
jgi:hypothetical protein